MPMADGHGKGIGLVRAQRLAQAQQPGDHVLNLLLGRAPGTDHGLLDLPRCVFGDRQPLGDPGADGRASGLSELEGGIDVTVHEHALDGHDIGSIVRDQRGDLAKYTTELVRQGLARDADGAACDPHRCGSRDIDDPEAGDQRTRIDAEHAD
jgi:hypothetical protein